MEIAPECQRVTCVNEVLRQYEMDAQYKAFAHSIFKEFNKGVCHIPYCFVNKYCILTIHIPSTYQINVDDHSQ